MNINELLSMPPEALAKLSTAELIKLTEPLFPAVRTPILPEEKPIKATSADRLMRETLAANADILKQFKEQRLKK